MLKNEWMRLFVYLFGLAAIIAAGIGLLQASGNFKELDLSSLRVPTIDLSYWHIYLSQDHIRPVVSLAVMIAAMLGVLLLFKRGGQRLRKITEFTAETYPIVEFYLRRKLPISRDDLEIILGLVKQDKKFVRQIDLKIEDFHTFRRVKFWQHTAQKQFFIEQDFFGPSQADLWQFSLREYISEDIYKKIIKDYSFIHQPETVKMRLFNDRVVIYGEGGRFGETVARANGRIHFRKSENVFLQTDPKELSKLRFSKNPRLARGEEGLYSKERNVREWRIGQSVHPRIFGSWQYSTRSL